MKILAALTPKKIAATVFTLGALGAGIAPAVLSTASAAAPGTSVAMYYAGTNAHPNMYYA